MLEMYVPIRANNSDKVIAVGELYFIARQLRSDCMMVLLSLSDLLSCDWIPWVNIFRKSAYKRAKESVDQEVETIQGALSDTLREIHQLSTDLRLPQIDSISAAEAVLFGRPKPERRWLSIFGHISRDVPIQVKLCLFRSTQECLNNAFKHAQGRGQRGVFSSDKTRLKLEGCDSGAEKGSDESGTRPAADAGIGLLGLNDRIKSLGDEMELTSIEGKGPCLVAEFDPAKLELNGND